MKNKAKPHPLRFTLYLLYRAVKKLRACNLHSFDTRAYSRYLWRGVKNVKVSEEFVQGGGTHTSCMSTTKSLEVVSYFCKSKTPLLFRIQVQRQECVGGQSPVPPDQHHALMYRWSRPWSLVPTFRGYLQVDRT